MTSSHVARKAGSAVMCNDGTRSLAGGLQGACSWHGGVDPSTVKAAVPSAPAVATRAHATVVRVSPPAPSTRNLLILIGLSGAALLAAEAVTAANARKARRDPQPKPA
jgi:hypothetical protein